MPGLASFDTLVHMAQLSNSDRLFLEQRRARKHIGLYVFPALLALLVLVWGALFVWWPLAVNPKAVLGAAESRRGAQTLVARRGRPY